MLARAKTIDLRVDLWRVQRLPLVFFMGFSLCVPRPPLGLGQSGLSSSFSLESASYSENPSEATYWVGEFYRLEALYRMTWSRNPVRSGGSLVYQGDGALVAWVDGSYALPAYLDMYLWSRDKVYLDRFVIRVRQLLEYMWDADQDGFSGWPTAQYSSNIVTNGDFELNGQSWQGIGETARLWKHTSKSASVLVLPEPGVGCAAFLPANRQGKWFLSLAYDAAVTQTIRSLPGWSRYELRANIRLSDDMLLHIALRNPVGEVLYDGHVTASDSRGPQGWQQLKEDIEIGSSQVLTLSISAQSDQATTHTVAIDNVVLSPYAEYLGHDFAVAAELARFAALVQGDHNLEYYLPDAIAFQVVAENIVVKWQPYWRLVDDQRAVYVAPTNGSVPLVPGHTLPYNYLAVAGLTLAWLGRLSEHTHLLDYEMQALLLANTLHTALRPDPSRSDALIWNYMDSLLPTDPPHKLWVEDVSHAGLDVRFMALMSRLDKVFTVADIGMVTRSIAGTWNGSETCPVFARYIDGSGTIPLEWSMPYRRHMEIGDDEVLRKAVSAAWRRAQNHIACYVQGEMAQTGSVLPVPTLMLLTHFPRSFLYLPVILEQ